MAGATPVNADSRDREKMAEILVAVRIMPEDSETDMSKLESELKKVKAARFSSAKKEPIAFGLVALKAEFISEDAEGGADKLEEELRKIRGAGEVEVTSVTRLVG